jgi:hypothetical protein
MKNIHLIPTDKPSRLLYSGNNKNLLFSKEPISFRTFERSPQNIYITNNEKIKEGDWTFDGENPYKWTSEDNEDCLYNPSSENYKGCKKIILTTDQDLIEDGIQAIDDEFLEWFVNNPSCEFVNIEKYHGINTSIAEVNYISGDGSLSWQGRSDLRDYKIIIPQEEPKQIKCYCGHTITCDCEPLQETLEEAACKALGYDYNDWVSLFSKDKSTVIYSEVTNWCKGAKWQAERSYSEEDIKEAFFSGCQSERQIKPRIKCWEQWIEQFKKK